jgi:dihydroorotate dehydrogenase (NAD+) catalytic subunit
MDATTRAPASVVAVEVNLSCPNVEDRRRMFAHDPVLAAEAIAATEGCGRPRWAKLSPNVTDLVDIAGAVLDAGADALTLINTVMGMAVDLETRRPVLGSGARGGAGRIRLPGRLPRRAHRGRGRRDDGGGRGGAAAGRG